MKRINRHEENGEQGMTKERQEILDKVVAKTLKENKIIFERLNEI